MAKSSFRSALAAALVLSALPAWGQVSARDRDEIVRLAQVRGATEADVTPLIREVDLAAEDGLPQAPLVNKAKEGLSKGHSPARVHAVLREMVGQLDTARDMLGTVADAAARTRATTMLAEALARGVTAPEFQELRRLADEGGATAEAEGLALGARLWAQLKEAGFAADAVLPLAAETIRQDYRASDITALARDMVARRDDLSSPARIESLRQAIRSGERVERLLPPREVQGARERQRVEPQRAPERPQRDRPERPR